VKVLLRDQGKLEQVMLDLQTKKHALEARLSTPLPPQEIGELGGQLKKIDDELAAHEEKWLAISEQIEAAS
jgi:ATP-binding cassette subfamily F protein 3